MLRVKFSKLVFGLILICASLADAQITGGVKGIVNDSSGAAVPAATVRIASLETGATRVQASDGAGRFTFNLLKIGSYAVTAEAEGFRQAVTDAVVRSGETAAVEFKLEVGPVTESVTVRDAVGALDAVDSQIHVSLDSRVAVELPVNRNPVLFALTAPGIVPATSPALNLGNYNAHGGRGRANNITIDNITSTDITVTGNGGEQVGPLNFEQIKEVKLITNNFNAEYGRNSSSQLQFITRSGTNDFHGVAYEYFGNNQLNARDFFDRAGSVSVLRHNQFGYAVGGPILRNRTHFFQTYEGTQVRGQGSARIADVPTPAMMAMVTDPTSRKLLEQFPIPVSETGQVEQSAPNFTKSFQFSFRLDHQLSERDSITARYAHFQSELANSDNAFPGSNINGFGMSSKNGPRNFNISETHLFSAAAVNEFRFAFGRSSPVFALDETFPIGPRIDFLNRQVNRFGQYEGGPQGRVQNTFQWSDTLSVVKGAHNVKMGADVYRYQANSSLDSTTRGFLRFSNWDDFAAGRVNSYFQRFGSSLRGHRVTNHFYFLQDDWRVARNLTLNLGVRTEVAGALTEVNGLTSNLDIGCRDAIGSAGTGRFGCFTTGEPIHRSSVNWGPRVGFAWNPGGDAKTVIRGGYGIAYDFLFLNPVVNQRFLPPFIVTGSLSGTAAFTGANSYAAIVAGASRMQAEGQAAAGRIDPNAKNFGAITPAIDTALRNPQVQQWSFGVQRELTRHLVLKAAYVGTKGNYLQRTRSLNLIDDARMVPAANLADESARLSGYLAAITAGSGNAARQSNRLDPRFNEINYLDSSANSNYHAFEFLAQKSFQKGLFLQAAYTVSKSIDDVSDPLVALSNDSATQQRPFDNRDNRAVSQFDLPQRLVITHVWELPVGRGLRNPVLRRVVSGWSVSGITSFRAGFPVTFDAGARRGIQALSLTGLGGGVVRPNVAGPFEFSPLPVGSAGAPNGLIGDPVQPYSAYAAGLGLSQPLLGHYGSLGRNSHRLNGQTNFDWSIYKDTAISERVGLQLRADFYNLFNSASFLDVGRNIGSPTFGQYTTVAQPARTARLGLRLKF